MSAFQIKYGFSMHKTIFGNLVIHNFKEIQACTLPIPLISDWCRFNFFRQVISIFFLHTGPETYLNNLTYRKLCTCQKVKPTSIMREWYCATSIRESYCTLRKI